MGMGKNLMYGDPREERFSLLQIAWTAFPNGQHLFEIRHASAPDDARLTIAVNAKPYEMISELRRIAQWLESQP
jgi:hypothetical protein